MYTKYAGIHKKVTIWRIKWWRIR